MRVSRRAEGWRNSAHGSRMMLRMRAAYLVPGIGRRSVYLYQLPEVGSTHRTLGVPNVSARFGTDPEFWNWAMVLMARLVPKGEAENPPPPAHFWNAGTRLWIIRIPCAVVGSRHFSAPRCAEQP